MTQWYGLSRCRSRTSFHRGSGPARVSPHLAAEMPSAPLNWAVSTPAEKPLQLCPTQRIFWPMAGTKNVFSWPLLIE